MRIIGDHIEIGRLNRELAASQRALQDAQRENEQLRELKAACEFAIADMVDGQIRWPVAQAGSFPDDMVPES